MARAVTLEDIGKALNLSRSTISRAMNMSPVVKEATRERIIAKAKELGFVPNKAARSLVLNRELRVAAVVFSEPDYFWRDVQTGVQKAAKELRDFRVHVEYLTTDIKRPEQQARLLLDLADQGVNGVVISPNDPAIVAPAIDALIQRGIPVLTVSADVPGTRRMCYVGCDYQRAGRIAGDLMARLMGGRGRIGVLTFAGTVPAITQRIAGFRDALREHPGIECSGPHALSRTGEETGAFVKDLLAADPAITGLFVAYGVLEQAGEALRQAGLDRTVTLVGYDMSEGIARLMRDGVIDASVCQEPFNQGYYPVKILADYLLEGRAPPLGEINTKLEIVTRENLPCFEHEAADYALLFDI
jgi:LacI family transcriptional regulator